MVTTLEAVDFGWRAARVLACLCVLVTTLPLLRVAVVVLCLLWNLELGKLRFVPLLLADSEDSDGNSWAQVAMCGMTSGS